ncbi:hypothetical protein [Flagellimonas oceanensis]|uniref:hypothetical protein n=1 Tax=Flagellimonas oceanensis TaxID=2499163 RepID=UPI003BA9AC1D
MAGWVAAGAKGAVRIVEASNIASKVKLTWKVDTFSGKILWPSDNYSRKQLRKVLGLTSSSTHARHIMPLAFKGTDLVQRAAKSSNAFLMNEFLNGFPLPSSSHLTGHSTYNNKIQSILTTNNVAISNMSPDQAFTFLNGLIVHIDDLLTANPSKIWKRYRI